MSQLTIKMFMKLICSYVYAWFTTYTVSINERQPKMYLLLSHSKNGKFAPFLIYLKSWWKVDLVFGKEHANWSIISGVLIGWSWKIKFGQKQFFGQNVNLKCQNTHFIGTESKLDDPILFPVKSSHIFW